VVYETDSISAAFNLEKANAKSPLMQEAFALLIASPEWQAMMVSTDGRERAVRHIKGKINVFADGESRGFERMLTALSAQMGVERRAIRLPCEAIRYLNAFVEAVAPQVVLELVGLGRAPSCTMFDGPSGLQRSPHLTDEEAALQTHEEALMRMSEEEKLSILIQSLAHIRGAADKPQQLQLRPIGMEAVVYIWHTCTFGTVAGSYSRRNQLHLKVREYQPQQRTQKKRIGYCHSCNRMHGRPNEGVG